MLKRALCILFIPAVLAAGYSNVPELIRQLKSNDFEQRAQAAENLGYSRDPRAVPPLIQALGDDDGLVRWKAADALGSLRAAEAVSALEQLAKDDPNDTVRNYAKSSAGKIKKTAVYMAFSLTNEPVAAIRAEQADRLGYAGQRDLKTVVPALVKALEDGDPSVRSAAARSLGRLKAREAVPALIARVEGAGANDPACGDYAAALTAIGDPSAVEPMCRWLAAPPPGLPRAKVVEALAGFKDPRAVGPLVAALKSPPDWHAIAAALKESGPQSTPALIEALQAPGVDADGAERKRLSALALGVVGGQGAGAALIGGLGDPDPFVRQNAAKALSDLKETGAVEPLIEKLKDPKQPVRDAAAAALGRLGDGRATQPLLDSAQGFQRAGTLGTLLTALGDLGDAKALPFLTTVLSQKSGRKYSYDDVSRGFAAEAAAKFDAPEAHQSLAASLQAGDEAVIIAARSYFIGRGEPGSEARLIEVLNTSKLYVKQLAQEMYTSQNPSLEKAAEEWSLKTKEELYKAGGTAWGSKSAKPQKT